MEYLENNKIKDDVIDDLIGKIEEFDGCEEYGCDLAYSLYEGDNMDGVCWFVGISYAENFAYIKEHWEDLPEILEELKSQFDSDYFSKIVLDAFDNSCRFVLIVFIEVASYLLSQCELVQNSWDDKLLLNKENIKILTKQLESLKD